MLLPPDSSLQPPCPLQISSYLIKSVPSPCDPRQDVCVHLSFCRLLYQRGNTLGTQQRCLYHGAQVQT